MSDRIIALLEKDDWLELAQFLKDAGLTYDTIVRPQDSIVDVPLICLAAEMAARTCLGWLLDLAKLNIGSELRVGLVHHAILSGNVDTLYLVLSHPDVLVHQADGWGKTPILYASGIKDSAYFWLLCRSPKITVSSLQHKSVFNRDVVFYGTEARNPMAVDIGQLVIPSCSLYPQEWYALLTPQTPIYNLAKLAESMSGDNTAIKSILSKYDLYPLEFKFESRK